MSNKIVFLLAPGFFELPLNVSKKLIKEGKKIGFYCVGIEHRLDEINDLGSENILFVENLDGYTEKWIKNENENEILEKTKFNLTRAIVADRKIGKPFIFFAGSRKSVLEKYQGLYGFENVAFRYINGLVKLIDKNQKKHKIDSLILYVVASTDTYVLFQYYKELIGEDLKILTPSRVDDLYYFINNLTGVFDLRDHEPKKLKDAEKYINEFREKNFEPEYMINVNSEFELKKLSIEFFKILFYLPSILIRKLSCRVFFENLNYVKFRQKIFYFKSLVFKSLKILRFKPDKPDFEKNYVYYPLHVDPEASTMVLSPLYTNQLFVIETLLKTIPNDHFLYVKEHKPMIGIRHKSFYKKIKKFPRVRLISPFNDQFELIKNSKFVTTITGTVGLEALLLKVPVILFGSANYETIKEGIIKVTDINLLEKQIESFKMDNKKLEEQLIKYIATIKEISFPLKDDAITLKFKKLNKLTQQNLINNFYNNIIN